METEAKYTLVGAAMIALAAALTAAVIWLSGGNSAEAVRYRVLFKDNSLRGLQPGSKVTMRGIQVGSVQSINILPSDAQRVHVDLEVAAGTPVSDRTHAVIERSLLTGLAAIELRTPPGGRLFKSPRLPLEIPEGTGKFEEMTGTAADVLLKLTNALERSNRLLSEGNLTAVQSTLSNFEKISSTFANRREDELTELIAEITEVAKSLRQLTGSLKQSIEEMKISFKAAADTIALESGSVSRNIAQAAQALSQTAEKYEDPKSIILGPDPSALGPGEQERSK